jgi:phage replication initiation protein
MHEIDVIIDWLEFTIKDHSLIKILEDLSIKIEDLVVLNTGLLHYNLTLVYMEKIKFLIKVDEIVMQRKEMSIKNMSPFMDSNLGVHIILSGYACREIERLYDFDFILEYAFVQSSQISRIDIAIDVFSNDLINLKRVKEYLKKGKIVAKAKKALIYDLRDISTGFVEGTTVRFGSSSSETQVVIYDKLAERECADYKIDDSIKAWNRIEIRLRRDSALRFLHNYFSVYDKKLGALSVEILHNLVTFKDWNDLDKNRSRRQDAQWWLDFLNNVEKLNLSKKSIQATIQQKEKWVDKSVLKTVASVFVANLDELMIPDITKYLIAGISKINASSLNSINTYRVERGASVITKEDLNIIIAKIQSLDSTFD